MARTSSSPFAYHSLLQWRVAGVFSLDRRPILQDLAARMMATAGLEGIVYLHSRRSGTEPWPGVPSWHLEDMSTNRSLKFLEVAAAVTPRTLLILDDVETIRNYPQSMTRNIINHVAPRTRFKLTGGAALVTAHLHDLYAEFAVLDKRILHATHYWAFAEDHREVSVFDGRTVLPNKDPGYLAAKLRPFVHLDLQPANELQTRLYSALDAAPLQERVHDVDDLRLRGIER